MDKIEIGKVSVETPTLWTAAVTVDGVQIGTLVKDPTATWAEWYSHDGAVDLSDGRVVRLADCDWGRTMREARKHVTDFVRGQLNAQKVGN